MDFALSEEQALLHQTVIDYLDDSCPLDRVRESVSDGVTNNETVRDGLVSLGIAGTLIPEQFGGVGLGMLEACLVAEALGRSVAPVPFTATSIMAATAILEGGSDQQKQEWLPRIASGETVVGVGVSDHTGRRDSTGLLCTASKLVGQSMFVIEGMDADVLLLSSFDRRLFLVEASEVERTPLKTIDRTRSLAKLVVPDVVCDLLPKSEDSSVDVLGSVIDHGRVALAADTLGASQTMLDKAIAYSKERMQFNRVIGSFQAVKHMCAEMAAELEPCRSLVWYAAHAARAIPEEARLTACHAKAHLSEVGKFVSRKATEVHGGMGFTDLLGLHFWFKRIGLNRQLLGTPEHIREEAARLQGWIA